MIRRSRCLLLTASVILVHMLVLSILDYNPLSAAAVNVFDIRRIFLGKKDQSFNEAVDIKFSELFGNGRTLDREKQDQLFLLDFKTSDDIRSVLLPSQIGGANHSIYANGFDPRVTLGLIYHYIAKELVSANGDLSHDIELPYFHWGDWVDLSALDPFLQNEEKETCRDYFDQSTGSRIKNMRQELYPSEQYCVNDNEIQDIIDKPETDETKRNMLKVIQQTPYSTGWHVFDYAGRSKIKLKKLQGKSYLHDFMPPPLSIVFLLPNSNGPQGVVHGLEINVSQDILSGKKRLASSSIMSEYTSRFSTSSSEGIVLDINNELKDLSSIVAHKSKDSNQKLAYRKVLTSDMFVDNSASMLQSLTERGTLSARDTLYKESLEYSIDKHFPPKYFYEAKLLRSEPNPQLGGHYDWRFFNGIINRSEYQSPALFSLIKSWLAFTNKYELNTWIAHGSLLSWYWNGVSFPWDNDIDVQMPIEDLHKLSRRFNQSIIVDAGLRGSEELRFGRFFMDCGAFISHRMKENGNNNIDARFIDMDSGLYIDITGLALSDTKAPVRYNELLVNKYSRASQDKTIGQIQRNEFLQAYNCRNNHFARLSEVSPLQLTMFEGQPAYIPYDFERLLINEYQEKGIASYRFREFTFVPRLRIWIKTNQITDFISKDDSFEFLHNLSVKDCLRVFQDLPDQLIEYRLTSNVTQLHEDEMIRLTNGESTEDLLLSKKDGLMKVNVKDLRHDTFVFKSQREASLLASKQKNFGGKESR